MWCSFCHVGEEGQPLTTYDFASDDKRPKLVARVMLDMTEHINGEHLADVPGRSSPPVIVRCETCHHGVTKPERLQDVLGRAVADSDADAAVRRYRALRERYYGSAAYDFREGTQKHRVSDGDAEEVFFTDPLIVGTDEPHSSSEQRYCALGRTNDRRPLFVVFAIRRNLIRLISAREMTNRELRRYTS